MEVYLLHTKAPRRRVFPFASLLDSDVSSSSSPAPVYPSVRKKNKSSRRPSLLFSSSVRTNKRSRNPLHLLPLSVRESQAEPKLPRQLALAAGYHLQVAFARLFFPSEWKLYKLKQPQNFYWAFCIKEY
ncbi:hypothetical protein KFK09_009246 [Dendrobium nobile]|uniref:Uncharacterized protein n=1 Tax=Dendrobium nobile TaxID=94219 RepID=A0A8T3BPV9_DENNO|nr:hypothetical protein KFK09_009246 [Dendrobium nobile]